MESSEWHYITAVAKVGGSGNEIAVYIDGSTECRVFA
jgi:hypothetical protein